MAEVTWQSAMEDFLNGLSGSREERTERFYRIQLRQLLTWALEQNITLQQFTAAHMRKYLAHRADPTHSDADPCVVCRTRKGRKHTTECTAAGRVKESTRRHDAIAARVFMRFCKREGYVVADTLHDFKLPKGEKPHVRMPSTQDLEKLLKAVVNKHDVRVNPKARFLGVRERAFWRARDYAIISILIETGMRIGEVLNLQRKDYRPADKLISVTMAKGDPRDIPITESLLKPMEAWLKLRPACGTELLFVTQFGEHIDAGSWSKTFRRYLEFAGIEPFTRHGIRHYVLTSLTNKNVGTAKEIAGHKDARTTLGYYHPDKEQIRSDHADVSPLAGVLKKEVEKKNKRRKLL